MTAHGVRSFDSQDHQRLELLLARFRDETRAQYVVLVDRAGQLLTQSGEPGRVDRLSFASLAAADFAASDQLAQLLGEQEFASLYHQAEGRGIFLADIGGMAILAALFDGRTTLGLLRLKGRSVIPELATLFIEVAGRQSGEAPGLEAGWLAEAESEIDRLFGS